MYNNFILLWTGQPIAWSILTILIIGLCLYPVLFLPIYIMVTAYILTVSLWALYQKKKSKGLGLKVTFLMPCERWLYVLLTMRRGVSIPPGRIWEMHLNSKKVYGQESCEENIRQFKEDIEHDLKLIDGLVKTGRLGSSPVVVLNTFNRYWLKTTEEILGGEKYPGIVMTKASCKLYMPKKHKKIFARMFPKCLLTNPGRNNPGNWDLIISTKKGDLNVKTI